MAGSMFTEKQEVTRISTAIFNNDLTELKQALSDGEDPHFKDRKQNTYLHYVCTMHRPFIIHIVIGTGIDLNAKNRHGNTALHVTALQNECCHVGDLLAAGVDSNITNRAGLTAAEIPCQNLYWKVAYEQYQPGIFEAIADHDVAKVVHLLHCWSRVDTNRCGQTLRQFAACRKFHDIVFLVDTHRHSLGAIYSILEGDAEAAAGYLAHSKCDINFVNHASRNAHILQYAIKLRDLQIVRMICRSKVNVSIPVTIQGYLKAPLFFEVLDPSVPEAMMWAVLKAGADFTRKDERGRNAAMYALDKTHCQVPLPVIAYMLKNGLDVSERDVTGVTLRDVARFARRRDIVSLLDKAFVKLLRSSQMDELERLCMMDYNSMLIDFNYRDSFIYASGNETEEVVDFIQWLPKFRASVRQFHHGVSQWPVSALDSFLTRSDRPDLLINSRDKGGRTALHLCILHWRFDVLKLLLKSNDLDINALDNLGKSALHYACALEEEDERNQFWSLLASRGINTEVSDNLFHKAEDYINNAVAVEWLKKEKKTHYGMVKQIACVDKYEELVHMMKYKGKNLKHFNKAVCRFRYPVPKFAQILSPLMPEYRDLLFVALDYGKEDIAIKLVQLGSDWRRKELCNSPLDQNESTKTSRLISAKDRAEELGMKDLLKAIESKKKYLCMKFAKDGEKRVTNDLRPKKKSNIYRGRKSFRTDGDGRQCPSRNENGDLIFEEEVVDSDDDDDDDDDNDDIDNVDPECAKSDNSKGEQAENVSDLNHNDNQVNDVEDFEDFYSTDSYSSGYDEESDSFELPE